ncbi:AI-2E family transporter [Cloacibacillus evryensis]|uniref:AI-2E family transporter n=1 Tax=Cloacibacillus evryensis TaxID=508460 RepID=UPI0026E0C9FF|nr:AI-2E family transporter [Cloacibacillus evryensis]
MTTNRYVLAAKKIRTSVIPLVVLLAFFAMVSWYIIKPLAMPLMWSILFSYFAYPIFTFLHKRLFRERYRNIAAAISTGVILVFIALPLLMLSIFVTREAIRISRQLMESGLISGSYADIIAAVKSLPIFGGFVNELDLITDLPIVDALIKDSARYVTAFLTMISSQIFESILKLALIILIVAITSFFLVRDGRRMIDYATDLLPLPEEERVGFVMRTAVMLKAVVCGIIMTAAVQGTLGGLGWWYVGLAHPVFFGFCMFMTAMIPFVGTPAIWVPGSAALFLRGDLSGCVILLLWGLLVVSSIDNFIKPIFISEGSKIHMLLIFVGLFGGLYAWGFLGVFVGPLILSLALFLLDIYHSIIKTPDGDCFAGAEDE